MYRETVCIDESMLRTLAQTVSRVRVPSYSARDALSNAAGGLLVVAWLRAQQSRHFAASEAATGAKTLPVRPANAVDSESDGVAAKGTQQQRQQQQQRRKAAQSDSGAPSPSKAEVNASRRASQERMLGRYSRAPDPPLLTSWLHWAETPEEARTHPLFTLLGTHHVVFLSSAARRHRTLTCQLSLHLCNVAEPTLTGGPAWTLSPHARCLRHPGSAPHPQAHPDLLRDPRLRRAERPREARREVSGGRAEQHPR